MIEFPPQAILQLINDWAILHFKDRTHAKEAPPHWYFTIPVDPGKQFVLCITTSRVTKKLNYYQSINPKAARSLVRLEDQSFSFIREESLINCNNAEKLSLPELLRRIDPKVGLRKESDQIPKALRSKILSAIYNSPLISPAIKKVVPPIPEP